MTGPLVGLTLLIWHNVAVYLAGIWVARAAPLLISAVQSRQEGEAGFASLQLCSGSDWSADIFCAPFHSRSNFGRQRFWEEPARKLAALPWLCQQLSISSTVYYSVQF